MLGEYAQDVADAPYILEGMIENWEEEDSAEVRVLLSKNFCFLMKFNMSLTSMIFQLYSFLLGIYCSK